MNATTVAGGHGEGSNINQLEYPHGLYLNEDQSIFVADSNNDRIVQWPMRSPGCPRVIAGANGDGNHVCQLNCPTDVLLDKESNALLICDRKNRRVMRWFLDSYNQNPEILFSDIYCCGLSMDDRRFVYISDTEMHAVRRYRIGEVTSTIVAGGKGRGSRLN